MHLFTDAAVSIGFAAFFKGKWFHGLWPASVGQANMCITRLELFSIYVACFVWWLAFSRKKIKFHSDNMGVFWSWQNLGSTYEHILAFIRQILMVAAVNNFTLTTEHITTVNNSIADALPRFVLEKFRSLAPMAKKKFPPIYHIFSMNSDSAIMSNVDDTVAFLLYNHSPSSTRRACNAGLKHFRRSHASEVNYVSTISLRTILRFIAHLH